MPTGSRCAIDYMHFIAFVFSPILVRLPFACLGKFWTAYVRCGQTFRIATLLAISHADADDSGTLDDSEFQEYERRGNKMINETNGTLGTIQIVAALLIGATHLTGIGRPIPWSESVSAESLNLLGTRACDGLLVLAYVLNALTETLALTILVMCIMFRFALAFVLSSLSSKLLFLGEVWPRARPGPGLGPGPGPGLGLGPDPSSDVGSRRNNQLSPVLTLALALAL